MKVSEHWLLELQCMQVRTGTHKFRLYIQQGLSASRIHSYLQYSAVLGLKPCTVTTWVGWENLTEDVIPTKIQMESNEKVCVCVICMLSRSLHRAEARGGSLVPYSIALHFITLRQGLSLHLELSAFPVSTLLLFPQFWGHRHEMPCPTFTEDLNSGSRACTASTVAH